MFQQNGSFGGFPRIVRGFSPLRVTSHFVWCCAIGRVRPVQSAVGEVEHLGPDQPVQVEGSNLEQTPTVRAASSGPTGGQLINAVLAPSLIGMACPPSSNASAAWM